MEDRPHLPWTREGGNSLQVFTVPVECRIIGYVGLIRVVNGLNIFGCALTDFLAVSLSLHSVASHPWVAIAQVMALAYGRGHRTKLIELMNQKEVVGDVFNQLRLALQRRTVGRQAQVYKTLNSVSILLLSLYHSCIHCQEQGWLHLMFILFECCIFLMVFW